MKNLIILITCCFCLCLCFCSRSKPTELKNFQEKRFIPGTFFKINYEDVLKGKAVMTLSQIAANVEYVPLETRENCMIGKGLSRYFITDKFIFVETFDHILKFSRNGRFLKKIGKPGQGPGKIDIAAWTSLIPDENMICVQTSRPRELLFFSFDGKLKKTLTFKQYNTFKPLAQNRLIVYDDGRRGNNTNSFVLVNEKMDTISFVKNYIHFSIPKERRFSTVYPSFDPFCSSVNSLFIKSMYNDTVYHVAADKIEPVYSINLGKYRFPDSLIFALYDKDGGKFLEKINDYYFSNVLQCSEKMFITAFPYGEGPSRRVYFDVNTRTGKLLVNNDSISTGFINDLDGGIDFWPRGMISDNQLFMPIRIQDLKKHLNRISTDKSVILPEKQKDLLKIITKSENSDNPIIMIVTLKPEASINGV